MLHGHVVALFDHRVVLVLGDVGAWTHNHGSSNLVRIASISLKFESLLARVESYSTLSCAVACLLGLWTLRDVSGGCVLGGATRRVGTGARYLEFQRSSMEYLVIVEPVRSGIKTDLLADKALIVLGTRLLLPLGASLQACYHVVNFHGVT